MTFFTVFSRVSVIGATIFILPLSSCAIWEAPPEYLKVDQDVLISFKSSYEASRECTEILVGLLGQKNKNFQACAIKATVEADPFVIFPNPCEFDESYASLLCHELGHVNQMEYKEAVNHVGWKKQVVGQGKSKKDKPVLLAVDRTYLAKVVTPEVEKAAELVKVKTAKVEKIAEVKTALSDIPALRKSNFYTSQLLETETPQQ